MTKYLLLISLALTTSMNCVSERPRPGIDDFSIVSLQIIEVIGPNIGSTRALSSPRDIAVNRLKEIFIADNGNDRIVKLDSNYAFIDEMGGFGASDYSLSGPIALAIDNVSNLYLIDSGNTRAVRLDRNLNFISSENGFTREEKIDFIRPLCIEVSDRGDIFIGDEGLGACFKLDQFFFYIYEFGGRDQIQSVNYPADIAFSSENRIYVADSDYGGILVFDDFGLMVQTIGSEVLKKPSAVAVSNRTGIWVTDAATGMLHCFSLSGQEIFRWRGHTSLQLKKPTGLFIDHDDTIYIVDSKSAQVFVAKPLIRK